MLLTGDIGGTKTNLAIIDPAEGVGTIVAEATFPSGRYPSLESIVQQFLNQTGLKVERASFGVAGPVVGGRATITNLPWVMDEHNLQRAFNLEAVFLLNDLVSIAYAVPHLEEKDLHALNRGRPEPGGAIAVLAPGTGLGEAFLTWEGTRYSAHPSEGGHADFAPTNKMEIKLLRYLHDRFDHVSFEQVEHGGGIGSGRMCRGLPAYGVVHQCARQASTRPVDDPSADFGSDQRRKAADQRVLVHFRGGRDSSPRCKIDTIGQGAPLIRPDFRCFACGFGPGPGKQLHLRLGILPSTLAGVGQCAARSVQVA